MKNQIKFLKRLEKKIDFVRQIGSRSSNLSPARKFFDLPIEGLQIFLKLIVDLIPKMRQRTVIDSEFVIFIILQRSNQDFDQKE
jgi:hypothetical protein